MERWKTVSESIAISLLHRGSHFVKVPVIVVLTKYDMLIDCMERTLDEASLDDEEFEEPLKNKAEAELQDTCIGPLEQFTGSDIPTS